MGKRHKQQGIAEGHLQSAATPRGKVPRCAGKLRPLPEHRRPGREAHILLQGLLWHCIPSAKCFQEFFWKQSGTLCFSASCRQFVKPSSETQASSRMDVNHQPAGQTQPPTILCKAHVAPKENAEHSPGARKSFLVCGWANE